MPMKTILDIRNPNNKPLFAFKPAIPSIKTEHTAAELQMPTNAEKTLFRKGLEDAMTLLLDKQSREGGIEACKSLLERLTLSLDFHHLAKASEAIASTSQKTGLNRKWLLNHVAKTIARNALKLKQLEGGDPNRLTLRGQIDPGFKMELFENPDEFDFAVFAIEETLPTAAYNGNELLQSLVGNIRDKESYAAKDPLPKIAHAHFGEAKGCCGLTIVRAQQTNQKIDVV